MPFNPDLPANGSEISSAELRSQFTALKALIDALLAGLSDGALANSALSEDGTNVIVNGKLLSIRRPDDADALLLEIHNGTTPVFHIRITNDGGRICFASNRGGFSFQTPLDINGAPAMKPVSIGLYTGTFSDPVTRSEMRDYAAWVESWRQAL